MLGKLMGFLLIVIFDGIIALVLSAIGYFIFAILIPIATIVVGIFFGHGVEHSIDSFYSEFGFRIIYGLIFFPMLIRDLASS